MEKPLLWMALLLALCTTWACQGEKPPGQTPVQALNARATALINEGKTAEAKVLLDSAVSIDPKYANSFKNKGNALRREGDIEGAIRQYNTAISLNNADGRYFNDRGFAFLRLHRYAEAVSDFDSALALDSTLMLAYASRGRTNFFLGNIEQSENDLARALKADSTNIYLAIWLHFIRAQLKRGDSTHLAADIAHMDTIAWPGPVARYFLGRISGDELLQLSAGHDSTTTVDQRCAWFFYRGEDDLINKRNASAIRNFEQAVSVCPVRFSEYYGAVAELKRLGRTPAGAPPPGSNQ